MRFMVLGKANENTEAGVLPTSEQLAEMDAFQEKLVEAGVLRAYYGLQASSKGARIRFDGDKRTVIDGPFAETKELIAGFCIVEVGSKEEAIELFSRAPLSIGDEMELRQVYEADVFGEDLAGAVRAQRERLRSAASGRERPAEPDSPW